MFHPPLKISPHTRAFFPRPSTANMDLAKVPFSCVRSAWSAALLALKDMHPTGGSVLLSALNIPHMVDLVKAHGFVPVPLDLETNSALPTLSELKNRWRADTRAVLVAHLFGNWSPLTDLVAHCHSHGAHFFEDLSQGFFGHDFEGTKGADSVFFSFGTIKRETVAGGAWVLCTNSPEWGQRLQSIQEKWPLSPLAHDGKKRLKILALWALSQPALYSLVRTGLTWAGQNPEQSFRESVRGFPNAKIPQSFHKRPCPQLVARLQQVWRGSARSQWLQAGQDLEALWEQSGQKSSSLAGHTNTLRSWWLLPHLSADPPLAVALCRSWGLDATRGATSLVAWAGEKETPQAAQLLGRVVYVPADRRALLKIRSLLP